MACAEAVMKGSRFWGSMGWCKQQPVHFPSLGTAYVQADAHEHDMEALLVLSWAGASE